jgi:hypothetical protein
MKRIVFKNLRVGLNNCKFVGYLKESIGYYFYHPIEYKVFVSEYVTFLEKQFVLEMSNWREIELKKVQKP